MKENISWQTDDELRQFFIGLCDRIEAADDTLHVFVTDTYSRDLVLEQVNQLLTRFPRQGVRPPLFGIPVGVKDIFHCDGFVTRCGSDLPPELFQGPEAHSVSRLKAAGVVMMGKTVTTEFAYFAPAATRNPVNLAHTPGGSSSGSAAGVAAGFFKYSLGTQTVGSVIRPAAYCGIAGFKPSLGRIDTSGVVSFSSTVDHVGVFGRSMSCLPPVLAVLDNRWQHTRAPDSFRLGVPVGAYLAQAEEPTLAVFRKQVRRLEAAGCDIVEVALFEDIKEINKRHSRLIAAEIARVHASWFEAQTHRYRSETREIITTGMAVKDIELAELRQSCPGLRNSISEVMVRHRLDAWICPATNDEAPEGLETTGSPLMNLPWTHAGMPAVTIPAGNGPGGLPLGLQLVGDFMTDEVLAALATKAEEILAE